MAGMTLSELNRQAREAEAEVEVVDPELVNDTDPAVITTEEQAIMDVQEALKILNACWVVLAYIADPKFVFQPGDRERRAIKTQIKEVRDFVEEVGPYYREKK